MTNSDKRSAYTKTKTKNYFILLKGLWRNGNASDYGSEDSRFDPRQARNYFIFVFFLIKNLF